MPIEKEVERKVAEYLRSDRSAVRRRYEELFGATEPTVGATPPAAEDLADEDLERSSPSRRASGTSLEEEFSGVLTDMGLMKPVENMVREGWVGVHELDRPIALHHLAFAGRDSSTECYQLEGLALFLGVPVASHIMHTYYPDAIFPIDLGIHYDKLRMVLQAFGITYDDVEEPLPAMVAVNLGQALEQYRESKGLEFWQMWALVYDLGPRLLPPPPPYPTDPPPCVWMSAAQSADFEVVDKHQSTDHDIWSINAKARRGDLVLMYNLKPRSAITAVYRCASDAYRDPFNSSWTGIWTLITDKIAIPPVSLKEMRTDPVFRHWGLVKRSFTGLLQGPVSPDIWNRLIEIVAAKNPKTGQLLAQYVGAVGGVRTLVAKDEGLSEAEVEERFVVPLLERLGWDMRSNVQRQFEMDIKVGSGRPHRARADFVGYRDTLGSDALLVVETKRRIRSESELMAAVEQCESYSGKLRCGRFAVAAPEAVWVYDLRFPGQSRLRLHADLAAGISPDLIERLAPHLGFATLRTERNG